MYILSIWAKIENFLQFSLALHQSKMSEIWATAESNWMHLYDLQVSWQVCNDSKDDILQSFCKNILGYRDNFLQNQIVLILPNRPDHSL